jgi:hypothetical protein
MPMQIPSHLPAVVAQPDVRRARRRRSKRALLALACFGALPALAACGGGSSAAGDDAETASTNVADDAAFCDVLGESAALANSFGDPAADPADVADSFARLAELAPDEVHDDVAKVADAMITMATAPMDDPDALSSAIEVAMSPEVTQATEAVGRYAVEVCGMTPEEWQG